MTLIDVIPGSWKVDPEIDCAERPGYSSAWGPLPRVRYYAGQADPLDESHFTIVYEADNAPGTIDGWLDDSDAVTLDPKDPALRLEVRDGPLRDLYLR
jgi:hypothetical protein